MNYAYKLTILPIISLFAAPAVGLSASNPEGALAVRCASHTGHLPVVFDCEEVDVLPSFPGGENEKLNFINATRRYPAADYENRIQGRVICSFIVNVDGSISDAAVIRGVTSSLDSEALRVINAMPNWIAGQIGGVNVPVYQVMSISFRL